MIEISVLADAAKAIVEGGLGVYKNTARREHLRSCVRDQIRRELTFNREVLDELLRTVEEDGLPRWAGAQRLRLIGALRTACFDALDAHLVPLTLFFDDELLEGAHARTFGLKDNAEHPNNYHRVRELSSQAELLERTYRRLHFCKLYEESEGRKPDLDYLRYLVVSSIRSLKD